MMKSDSVLTMLQERADEAASDAALRLQQARSVQQAAHEQLQMLVQVQDEYHARLKSQMQQGVSLSALRNFQQFIAKVETAIDGQQKRVKAADVRTQTASRAWQDKQRESQSYATLIQRQHQQALQLERRHEQLLSDDYALQAARRRSH